MPEEADHFNSTIQGPTSGRALFRLIVQSLLRAGVKAVPVIGSSLDQALEMARGDALSEREMAVSRDR